MSSLNSFPAAWGLGKGLGIGHQPHQDPFPILWLQTVEGNIFICSSVSGFLCEIRKFHVDKTWRYSFYQCLALFQQTQHFPTDIWAPFQSSITRLVLWRTKITESQAYWSEYSTFLWSQSLKYYLNHNWDPWVFQSWGKCPRRCLLLTVVPVFDLDAFMHSPSHPPFLPHWEEGWYDPLLYIKAQRGLVQSK